MKPFVPTLAAALLASLGVLHAADVAKPAGRPCITPVSGMDFYPTILALAGLELPSPLQVDGVSLLPLLQGAKIPQPYAGYDATNAVNAIASARDLKVRLEKEHAEFLKPDWQPDPAWWKSLVPRD